MKPIRIIHYRDAQGRQVLKDIRKSIALDDLLTTESPELHSVQNIIATVHREGDRAVCEFSRQFDSVDLTPDKMRVTTDELAAAHKAMDDSLIRAIRTAADNVMAFGKQELRGDSEPLDIDGAHMRARFRPLRRVGVCVPGASAPLPSTALMSIVPAQAAGVKEIAVVAPPRHKGSIHPSILAVCHELGVTEVYRVGGAHAVAALAFGTQTIPRVDKIVGPGSIYTQLAKKLVFGAVDIDSFAGPSEIVVIADSTANPAFVATDLLAQAEHDPGSAILLTDDESLADKVVAQIEIQLQSLDRAPGTRRSLSSYSAIVITESLEQAVQITNDLAPEHLQIQTANADIVAEKCVNAGAIFVGEYTPEATGDYVAGPSHVLPTGGSARFFSGLSSNDFIHRTSVIRYTKEALAAHADAITMLAETEGLQAHARSTTIRVEQ